MTELTELLIAYKSIVIGVWIIAFFLAERLLPAARVALDSKSKQRRLIGNGGLFAVNMGLSLLVVVPVSAWAAGNSLDWRLESTPWWGGWQGLILDLILLDFLIYWWHRANHVSQFLWRFHEVHHLDETLDTTTAVRFHWGEVFLSALARAVFIILFDIPIESVLIFETQVLLAAIFNHSNAKLPKKLERVLGWILVTPAIHWVHHHAIRKDTDSNYGNFLSIWDRLFGSFSKTNRWAEMPMGVEREPEKGPLQLQVRPFQSR